MLDEVLYMQVRLFRLFRERTGLSSVASNEIFNRGGIWDFVTSCYDYLHLGSDEAALDDVLERLDHLGVTW
ncbi:MAG: DUF3791 domain-containing protein [Coriobacteriales bacterium]|nr:DUF3791 domain-containing protein [Coriobacteriales bacterium]